LHRKRRGGFLSRPSFPLEKVSGVLTYVQAYFQQIPGFDLTKMGQTYTIHLRKVDIVDTETLRQFARYKDRITQQMMREEIRYEV
jgi:hypothetical protein